MPHALGSVVDHLGTDDFTRSLRAALHDVTGYNSCVILTFFDAHAPKLLEHDSSIHPERFQQCYMREAYRFDPFYRAALSRKTIGISRCEELSDCAFGESEYFMTYYKDVPIVDEIGMLCPIDEDVTVHISLGRCSQSPRFEDEVLRGLYAMEPLFASLIRKHAALKPDFCARDKQEATPGSVTWLKQYNATRREIEVASLVLRGHTNGSIAHVLGISEDTVKVHRKRLYYKLSISSQAELFMMFMRNEPRKTPCWGGIGSRPTRPEQPLKAALHA